jgi:membrane protease YdiL (CAAX protease family)
VSFPVERRDRVVDKLARSATWPIAASHVGATYVTPGEILPFVVPVFLVGFGAGWLIVKTDSLWGAVLFHAGADVFYALAFTFFSVG